jgi:hypothetical protein
MLGLRLRVMFEEGSDKVLCLRLLVVPESSTAKKNTMIRAASGVSAKKASMPKSIKSLGEL